MSDRCERPMLHNLVGYWLLVEIVGIRYGGGYCPAAIVITRTRHPVRFYCGPNPLPGPTATRWPRPPPDHQPSERACVILARGLLPV